jgi:hypothetical protein
MSKRICKGSPQSEEVAHYVISQFLENPKAQPLIDTNDAMSYLSGAIWRSFNSSTSPYHTIYREKGRTHSLKEGFDHGEYDNEYDFERDMITEEIEGILTDMEVDTIETWFQSTLFKMYIQTGNYSEIARKTKIPRTSISHAVNEARDYIQQTLKKRGIEWNY